MNIRVILFSLFISALSFNASASVIFNFSIDDVSQFDANANTANGDSFSIRFYDDNSFNSGISIDDIESIGFNTAFLGSGIISAPFVGISDANLQEIFSFSFLNNRWTLNLLVGVTGIEAETVFAESTSGSQFQLAQTTTNGGSTNFSIENANGDMQFLHNFRRSNVFSAVSVSEPSTIALFMLVLFGTFLRIFKTKNIV